MDEAEGSKVKAVTELVLHATECSADLNRRMQILKKKGELDEIWEIRLNELRSYHDAEVLKILEKFVAPETD